MTFKKKSKTLCILRKPVSIMIVTGPIFDKNQRWKHINSKWCHKKAEVHNILGSENKSLISNFFWKFNNNDILNVLKRHTSLFQRLHSPYGPRTWGNTPTSLILYRWIFLHNMKKSLIWSPNSNKFNNFSTNAFHPMLSSFKTLIRIILRKPKYSNEIKNNLFWF